MGAGSAKITGGRSPMGVSAIADGCQLDPNRLAGWSQFPGSTSSLALGARRWALDGHDHDELTACTVAVRPFRNSPPAPDLCVTAAPQCQRRTSASVPKL